MVGLGSAMLAGRRKASGREGGGLHGLSPLYAQPALDSLPLRPDVEEELEVAPLPQIVGVEVYLLSAATLRRTLLRLTNPSSFALRSR